MLHLLIERKPGKYENLCECFSCLLVNDLTMAFKCLILSPFLVLFYSFELHTYIVDNPSMSYFLHKATILKTV